MLAGAVPTPGTAGRPLVTAITDDFSYGGSDAELAFERTRKAGARMTSLVVRWDAIAPGGAKKPASFDPSDPADPAYRWSKLDRKIRLAVASGLRPIVGFYQSPAWAEDKSAHPSFYDGFPAGPYKPSPAEIGEFAHALAVRYSGSFQGLPRVRYWRLWNEPNLIGFLSPQYENGQPFAPAWYRLMLDSFARAVRAVHRDNVVVAGTLAPFSNKSAVMAPLTFMRSLFCLSRGTQPKPVCGQRSSFDAFSVHPYTSGGPTHRALTPEDLSLGNVGEAWRVLHAADRYNLVRSRRPAQLWVTEFSWDTHPPDPSPLAAPLRLQARWTAEAMYRMWRAHVSVFTWFLLRDLPWPESPFQSGLYFRSGARMALDVRKPTLTAFRFPFVAYRHPGKTFVWGRTPGGRRARIVLEQRRSRSWKRVATLRSDRYGIFQAVLRRKLVRPRPVPSMVHKSYSAAVVADSPTSYWRLGDSGTPARDLMGRRPATATGGSRFGVPGALVNDRDTAVELNGVDGKIDLGPIASPHTVELWIKTSTEEQSPFFSNRNSLHQFVFLGTFLNLPQVFDSFNLLGGRRITSGRWHHVVYTYSGVTGRMYVDGRLDGVNTWIRQEGGAEASLGFDAALGTYFKGSIDEVAVYGRALSTAQVRRHYIASGRKLAADPPLGSLRARLLGSSDASLPFSLTRPPDRFVWPFGV